MNYLALTKDQITLIILAVCILPILLLMVYAIIVALRRGRNVSIKRNIEANLSDDFSQRNLFLDIYGGEDNISKVTLEMSRISVVVEDIEKVKVEELKELGANGVLLVSNVVKCSFGDRAPYIYNLLKKDTK